MSKYTCRDNYPISGDRLIQQPVLKALNRYPVTFNCINLPRVIALKHTMMVKREHAEVEVF